MSNGDYNDLYLEQKMVREVWSTQPGVGGFEVIRLDDEILFFLYETSMAMSGAFFRLSELVRQEELKGRRLSWPELWHFFSPEKGPTLASRMEGVHGWEINPPEYLSFFGKSKFSDLSPREQELSEALLTHRSQSVVAASIEQGGNYLRHEVAHALYWHRPGYWTSARRLLAILPARASAESTLRSMGYREEELEDELQARVAQGGFFDQITLVPHGEARDEERLQWQQLEKAFVPLFKKHLGEAAYDRMVEIERRVIRLSAEAARLFREKKEREDEESSLEEFCRECEASMAATLVLGA